MKYKILNVFFVIVIVFCSTAILFFLGKQISNDNEIKDLNSKINTLENKEPEPPVLPNLKTEVVVDSLIGPWDIGFIDENTFLFTQIIGKVSLYKNAQVIELSNINDVVQKGEGGLLGLAIDSKFSENNFVYFCFNTNQTDIKVARFVLNVEERTLSERKDIIKDIPAHLSGRHSGCQLEFSEDEVLWVGTGDAANSSTMQDPKNLGGKILRVDRDGNPVVGNLLEPFDPRVFSYGHRNTQGIALFPGKEFGIEGVSVEHGSSVDDEVNALLPGNFGWAPKPSYDESNVPMTDLNKFPDAVEAIWSSGNPTIASSGATFITGDMWAYWDKTIAFANLKGERIVILKIDDDLNIISEHELFKSEFGRIRTIQMGLDGNLYMLTSNGAGDKIIRVSVEE